MDQYVRRQHHRRAAGCGLERRFHNFQRIDDPCFHHVGELARAGVEAGSRRAILDLSHDRCAVITSVANNRRKRRFERFAQCFDGELLGFRQVERVERSLAMDVGATAARNDAARQGVPQRCDGTFCGRLPRFDLTRRGAADLQDRYAPDEPTQPFLYLLAGVRFGGFTQFAAHLLDILAQPT